MTADPIRLAEELNQRCHCITLDRSRLERILESGPTTAGLHAGMLRDQPHLLSSSPVFIARSHLDTMQRIVGAIESVVRSEPYREAALSNAPPIARLDHGPRGVFLGYDFHLGSHGPQLIEINTNAGGGLVNAALARAQQACCVEVESQLRGAHLDGVEQRFVGMFRTEWRLQRGDATLRSVAIVDEDPGRQYLYPEFLLFQDLFQRAGLAARIVDVRDLRHEGSALMAGDETIDLVYNRLTDFHMRGDACSDLRRAYEAGDVVLTPHPRTYALYADKRNLIALSDSRRLRDWGFPAETVELLASAVPRTVLLEASRREELWKERRSLFFKPVEGYGSKAAYRGDKLTRSVWDRISGQAYIAQRLVPPSQRTILVDGREVPLKVDLRNYVYDGEVQLVAARLYQGQTTNFRTAGGGFAPVFTEATPLGELPAALP